MKLWQALLDLLYPPRCVLCGRLLSVPGPICARCMDTLPEYDGAAPAVRFTSAGCVSFYYQGTLRESFLRFKFSGASHYAGTYGTWMAHTIRDKLDGRFDVLTWAPVSRARRRRRGYDQAELLCRAVGKQLGMQPVCMLRKIKNAPAQSSLEDAARRRANVSGAYVPYRPERCAGQRVLVIDDIVTTGATLGECSRVLRMAGAADVVYAALAAPEQDRRD